MPDIRSAEILTRQTQNKEMSLNDIKNFMLQLEADLKNAGIEEKKALRVHTKSNDDRGAKCHKCSLFGHVANDCHLKKTNQWYCYFCRAIRSHKGEDCPNYKPHPRKSSRGKYTIPRHNPYRHRQPVNDNQNNGQYKSGNNQREFAESNFRGRGRSFNVRNTERAIKRTSEIDKTGKIQTDSNNEITFIADSGATDHIVSTDVKLGNLQKINNEVIKSANKNGFK